MVTIELLPDQIVDIVVESLMDDYVYAEDPKVIKAIKRVLKYYMTPTAFEEWKENCE